MCSRDQREWCSHLPCLFCSDILGGSVKQFLAFVSRTVTKRLKPGSHIVTQDGTLVNCRAIALLLLCVAGYYIYAYITASGLSAVAACDADYPRRVAFTLLRQLSEQFQKEFG